MTQTQRERLGRSEKNNRELWFTQEVRLPGKIYTLHAVFQFKIAPQLRSTLLKFQPITGINETMAANLHE